MKTRAKHDFSLLELLVAIAIIAMLCSLLLPALGKAKEGARRIACVGKLKQLALGITVYAGDYANYLPGCNEYYTWHLSTTPSSAAPKGGGIADYMGGYKTPYAKYCECPSDRRVWESNLAATRYFLSPSYGATCQSIGLNAYSKCYPLTSFKYPARRIALGERIHITEGGTTGGTYSIDYSLAPASELVGPYWRHGATGNVLWYDGHVSSESQKDLLTIGGTLFFWQAWK